MRRFFIPSSQIKGDNAVISGTDARHLTQVLRKKEGDRLEATDGKGCRLTVEIKSVEEGEVALKIIERVHSEERPVWVKVFQAVPRHNRFDMIIEKLTELGVNEIYPLITERTVPRYDEVKGLKKRSRWERIALETMKKVGRVSDVSVKAPVNIKNIAQFIDVKSLKILPWELDNETLLKDFLRAQSNVSRIELVIGPEGGFASDEVGNLQNLGFNTVSLGNRILTVETASITTVSNIYYEFSGD